MKEYNLGKMKSRRDDWIADKEAEKERIYNEVIMDTVNYSHTHEHNPCPYCGVYICDCELKNLCTGIDTVYNCPVCKKEVYTLRTHSSTETTWVNYQSS